MLCRFVVLVAATLPLARTADIPANLRVIEEIAAKVNGEIITRGELDDKHKEIETFFKGQGFTGAKLAAAVKEAEADALEEEIDTLLLVQKGRDLNVKVDAEVTRFFNQKQIEAKESDPDKFHEWLRQQFGVTYEELKDRETKSVLAQRVVGQEVGSRIAIPEAELQKYYDEHKSDYLRQAQVFLSQIVISTEGKTTEQVTAAQAKAKSLVAQARAGEKFADLARQNSDNIETGRDGGYIGPRPKGTLRPEIEAIVFKENKGYITDPIKIPSGLLILKIEDRYETGQASFEEVKDEIHGKLVEPRIKPRLREYLNRLREEAFLEIKDGYVDSGAVPGKDTRWHDVAQLTPATVRKQDVAAANRPPKKLLFIPIPGTHKSIPADSLTADASTSGASAATAPAKPVKAKPEKPAPAPKPAKPPGPPLPPITQ